MHTFCVNSNTLTPPKIHTSYFSTVIIKYNEETRFKNKAGEQQKLIAFITILSVPSHYKMQWWNVSNYIFQVIHLNTISRYISISIICNSIPFQLYFRERYGPFFLHYIYVIAKATLRFIYLSKINSWVFSPS